MLELFLHHDLMMLQIISLTESQNFLTFSILPITISVVRDPIFKQHILSLFHCLYSTMTWFIFKNKEHCIITPAHSQYCRQTFMSCMKSYEGKVCFFKQPFHSFSYDCYFLIREWVKGSIRELLFFFTLLQ